MSNDNDPNALAQAEHERDQALYLAQKNGEAAAEHYGRALDAEQAIQRVREALEVSERDQRADLNSLQVDLHRALDGGDPS